MYRLLKESEHDTVSTASSEVVCSNSPTSRRPITVSEVSNAWTVSARSKTEIVSSIPTEGMDVCVCVCFFYIFVVSCV
jgi:hypothetical protein